MTKHDFYRYCRLVHGWLSAIAFLALCFFAFTGLLLNHPDWFSANPAKVTKESYSLSESEVTQLRGSTAPAQMLVEMTQQRTSLQGELGKEDAQDNLVGDEVFVRMRGVRGTSFLRADLRSAKLEVSVESTSTLSMLNELHRAERAGTAWRAAVDVMAIVLLVLSIIGYLIFLSMVRRRVRTALLLTLGSAISLGLIFALAVR